MLHQDPLVLSIVGPYEKVPWYGRTVNPLDTDAHVIGTLSQLYEIQIVLRYLVPVLVSGSTALNFKKCIPNLVPVCNWTNGKFSTGYAY
eukprot:SAG31_NODE_1167_length_9572_cov_3.794046_10_plen_89_part_00